MPAPNPTDIFMPCIYNYQSHDNMSYSKISHRIAKKANRRYCDKNLSLLRHCLSGLHVRYNKPTRLHTDIRNRKYREALGVDWKQAKMGKRRFKVSMKVNDAPSENAHCTLLHSKCFPHCRQLWRAMREAVELS
ncbi:unnamed protein product [Brugia pahangi]|uniref:Transposase n=1 Tax=Brugia pahangi TaxID=6280 RepID=A0A0N4TXY2_BRUPA|nr:unnamed protein product [Brugia pahangi]